MLLFFSHIIKNFVAFSFLFLLINFPALISMLNLDMTCFENSVDPLEAS